MSQLIATRPALISIAIRIDGCRIRNYVVIIWVRYRHPVTTNTFRNYDNKKQMRPYPNT